jgi:hypothetical protein
MKFFSGERTETCRCGKTCEPVEKKQPVKPIEKKDDQSCNPFQNCKCCVGFNTDFAMLCLLPQLFIIKLHDNNQEKIPPHIALDFWQPPKIA